MSDAMRHVEPLRDLPLAQSEIDFDVASRTDEGLIDRLLDDEATKVLLVREGSVAVRGGASTAAAAALSCADDPAAPRPDAGAPAGELDLVLISAADVRRDARRPGALVVYLGCEHGDTADIPYLALDITRIRSDSELGRAGADHEPDGADAIFGDGEPAWFDWLELRSFAPCASARDAGLATSAIAITTWQRSQRFCPYCGSPVVPIWSGWAQTCSNPDDAGRLLFPRIEPAVITAIVDDDDRLLLQHNRAWRPRFHSVSAEFVEAGESLEHAVRREAKEEVGIEVDDVRYLGSQPWPFPASIMLAFRAHACDTDIRVDEDEVGSARWFTREELIRAVATGEIESPGRASIARHMIEQWVGKRLP